jgi:heat shock protein 4
MFQALEDAKVGLGDIASVEVTGGSSRVPALITHLRDFFGKEPSRTLNATEVVSRGCALNCAMLSPIFRCARGAPARCNGTVSRI